jgi:hypothetical protein
MRKISLAEAIAEVRRAIIESIEVGEDEQIRFPVGPVSLSFQCGLTTSGTTSGGVKLWVLELGTDGSYARETVQTITVTLEPPVGRDGRPIRVAGQSPQQPR